MVRDGDLGTAHERLEDVLVHAHRRGEHAPGRRTRRRRARRGPEPSRPRRTGRGGSGARRRPRRALRARSRPGPGASPRSSSDGSSAAAVARRQCPAAVAADLDRPHVVALRVECRDDGGGGRQRDLVLARPASCEHRQPYAPAHGVGGGVAPSAEPSGGSPSAASAGGAGVTSGGGTNSPTVSVTTESGSACVPPAGSCDMTRPSSASSSVSCRTIDTRKPAARERRPRVGDRLEGDVGNSHGLRAARDGERHGRATGRRRVAGRRLVDDLAGRPVALDLDPADGEARELQLRRRDVVARADDVRHGDRLRPLRDVDPHRRAFDEHRARARVLRRDDARRLVRRHLCDVGVEAGARELGDRGVARLARRATARRSSSCPSRRGS